MGIVKDPIMSQEGAYCLKGKNAIVTGGNRGIGLGIATAFAQQGANVGIMCRNQESAKAAVAEFSEKYDGTFRCYAVDISDMQQCRDAVAAFIADFGSVDTATTSHATPAALISLHSANPAHPDS